MPRSRELEELSNGFDEYRLEEDTEERRAIIKVKREPRKIARAGAPAGSGAPKMIESDYPPIALPAEPYHKRLLKSIKHHIDHGKNKIAFVNGEKPNETITFKQVYDSAYSIAAFLYSKGFEKDVACAVIPNLWHYSAFFLGVALRGGAVSGASAMFTDYELQRQFVDSGAKVVLTSEHYLEKVVKAVKESPNVKLVIYIPEHEDHPVPEGVVSWNVAVKSRYTASIPEPCIDVDKDMIILPYSSGTTGPPKGVMLSHRNFACMMEIYSRHEATNIARVLDPDWDYEQEKLLLFLPFYHAYGFGLINFTLLVGSTGIIFKSFDPHNFCRAIQDHKASIRILPLVPPIMVFLAKHPVCDQYDLSSISLIICGAAPAGKDICEELSRKYPKMKYIQQGLFRFPFPTRLNASKNSNGRRWGVIVVMPALDRCRHQALQTAEQMYIAPGITGYFVERMTELA
ncbi:AMP-binding enzyme [Teladorsagia circumcincta]|uniref:AMP-binding enzyme n=1 Tax=Teladorsagia circumcincta TaxID=45464 RepID=A0A2G9V0Q2_TELCI|nr:AMP-binding enzyme [Teladorsagia circumcincta]